jgi:NAD(P)H-quinone oxidoreductase subunit 6
VNQSIVQIFEVVKLSDLVFFAFAGLTVTGALGCAISKNIVYSAFSLLATLFGVAALFAWLSADYLAITQLIVYVGGVLVLFLFAVMLTNRITDSADSNPLINVQAAMPIGLCMGALLIYVAVQTPWEVLNVTTSVETTAMVGNALLTQYLLPFEVASILILGALVGAVMMARKEIKE